MKGIILAGGLGTRLRPLTLVTNKHLLPVYDRPMILYPLETLKKSGIEDIMIVCGREFAGHFMNFLGFGEEFGVKLSYALQDKNNGGIADALRYAEKFAHGGSVAVILGDNIFESDFKNQIINFKTGTLIFLKEMSDPRRFGSPVFDESGSKILQIEEKPKNPKSPYAHVGFYVFDHRVFNLIKNIKPSARGELEIVDVVNEYIKLGEANHEFVEGFWSDAGTIDSLMETSKWLHEKSKLS